MPSPRRLLLISTFEVSNRELYLREKAMSSEP
jgi:hypothetical protein